MATTRKLITGITAALILSAFSATTAYADPTVGGGSFFSSFDGFLDDLYRNIGPFYRNIGPF